MDIRNFLTQQGWQWTEHQRPSGLIAQLNCPFCNSKDKSFGISLIDGAFSCLRLNNCGVKGSFWDLQKMLGIQNPSHLDDNKKIYQKQIKYEKPIVKSEKNSQALEWLSNRGIWKTTSEAYRIGQQGNEIMFPYFKDGELVNVKYRLMNDKKFRQEKNAEPTLFGRDFCKGKEEITLCEGEIDCLTLSQFGINVSSIPSGASDLRWLEHEWDFLNNFKKIYLCLDNDEAGQKNIDEIVSRLGRWRCYNVILPFKDANECLKNNISEDKIIECFSNARGFDPATLLKPLDFLEDIVYLNENPEERYGISYPWNGLNKILRGCRHSELTIWSGRSGSGKSTILNEVIDHDITLGVKDIIASLEMPPMKYLNWMIMQKIQKSKLDRNDITKALNSMGNLFIVNKEGQIGQNELFDIFDFAARKYGVKRFIIDSLMKINISGQDKYEEQKNFVNRLIDDIAKKYKSHVHLVAHPRKGFKDTDKPDKSDVSGTGDITNLADNVIILYRLSEKEKENNIKDYGTSADTIAYVVKGREWGTEGEVNFNFNPDIKKFMEV